MDRTHMTILNETVPLDLVKPHPNNYNQHPETQIADLEASLDLLSQYRSVVLWAQDDGTYIQLAGHGVVEAMKRKGDTEVRADILPVETDATMAKQIMLADNLHARHSLPEDDILARLLKEQQMAGVSLASLGSGEEELRQLLEAAGESMTGQGYGEGDGTEDELPEDVETRCKPGDIWQLGRHVVGCLDALSREQIERLIHGQHITFVFSDPPYGIEIVATNGYVGGGEAYDIPFGGVKNRKGDVGGGASHIRKTGMTYMESNALRGTDGASKPFGSKATRGTDGATNIVEAGKYYPVIGDDSPATAIEAYRLCADLFPKAVQIWWGANYYANALPPSKCWLVWDKENTGNFADAELAWCSDKSAVRLFKHRWNGMLKDSEHGIRRVHPTQKPIALAVWCFEQYGKEDDVIYDPFLGSGISVIAAERLGRMCYGCELSPEYIDVIIARWEAETGQTAHLVEQEALTR